MPHPAEKCDVAHFLLSVIGRALGMAFAMGIGSLTELYVEDIPALGPGVVGRSLPLLVACD